MDKTYLGLASKVGHNEELTKQYNELLDKLCRHNMYNQKLKNHEN